MTRLPLHPEVRFAGADMVNHPDHYKVGGIEAIDYIEAKLSPEEFAGYCRGNALKYISRAGHKDATAQEVGKAIWYLERWRGSLARTDKPTQSYAPQSGAPSPAGRSDYRNEWDAPLRSTD
jgi:hypothetical protein